MWTAGAHGAASFKKRNDPAQDQAGAGQEMATAAAEQPDRQGHGVRDVQLGSVNAVC